MSVVFKRFSSCKSAGSRHKVAVVRTDLHKGKPEKSLTSGKKRGSGRNNMGRITVRHQGGGHKQRLRDIDFLRSKDAIPAKVERIEYDPNRTSFIALLVYADGHRSYIVASKGMKAGDVLENGSQAPIKVGNCMPLRNIPTGSVIHCIEMKAGKGAQLVRSAGGYAQLVAREGLYATVRLRSGEVRKIHVDCRATLGEVSNAEHNLISLGKAGAKRRLGVRPTVRGVAMNPVDHPHGGGEGKTSGGRHPVTPWGVKTKGYKTRNNKRTDKFIISRKKK